MSIIFFVYQITESTLPRDDVVYQMKCTGRVLESLLYNKNKYLYAMSDLTWMAILWISCKIFVVDKEEGR